ncbi:hypothetical protein RUM43_008078 [Polyplax serrata]|uniref:J domain-containing protein n=1 Tax=Polyplax serrata TaxID=468196 RepID=A0AAN8PN11_POLSC
MEDNDNLAFKERSLDELIGHLASDMQGDGQYNHMRFPQGSTPSTQCIGPESYPNENLNPAFLQRHNVYFQDNYQNHQRDSHPFILNPPREDLMPGMVDMRGGDYVIFGSQHPQKSHNGHSMNYMNKTNGTLTGFNNYGMEFPTTDYNLFSGISPPRHQMVPQFSHNQDTNSKAQLIENLVGNWASDQSGTYSPFGTPLGGLRSDIIDNISMGRGNRKTRIVAEVRPMRPSYSDVLAKSIANNSHKQTNQKIPIVQDAKLKNTGEIKIKPSKFSVGRTLSGNGNILNRQMPTGVDEPNYNTNLKGQGMKKISGETEEQESLSKKWLSLDDLKNAAKRENYIHLNEVKNKKNSSNSAKNTNVKTVNSNVNNRKDKWESTQMNNTNNAKNLNSKIQMTKKQEKTHLKMPVAPVREKEFVTGSKYGILRNRTTEEKRVPTTSQVKSETQKSTKRTARNCQPEKHRKTVRNKRREQEPCISAILKIRMDRYGGVLLFALNWLLRLVLDVLGLSTHLAIHMCAAVWASSVMNASQLYKKFCHTIKNIEFVQRIINSRFCPFRKTDSKKNKTFDSDDETDDSGEAKVKRKIPRGLKHNISLPVTGEEAMKRLLACKGKDPYSILGVTQDCTDDDIKKYYKRQAFLVHPDKNNQPGAEEAFKILVHAFDIIGEPEHRKSYDRRVEKTQFEQAAWSELSDLLSQLHKKMEYVANTIRCTNCNKRHKRTTVDRPMYAARMCNQCKIHHSVREGDIWAETSMFGLLWHYYACMDGAVYDITEWAGCQGSNLRNLKANTHNVQYRIVLGKQHGQKQKYQQPAPTSEPDFEDFMNNFYTRSDRTGGADVDKMYSAGKKRKTKKKK